MAGRPSLNVRSLEALGATRLAELLLQHTEGNAAARRALRLALAETRGPQEMAQEVRKRLTTLDRSGRWLDRRAFAPVLAELESQRQAISTAIGSQAPALAVELLWRLLELAPSLLDRVDDGDDAGLALFHRASADLGRLACQARLPAAALADQVAEAVLDNREGQYDLLVSHLAEALTPEGLRQLRQRLEQERPVINRPDELLVEDEPDEAEEEGVLVHAHAFDPYGLHPGALDWEGDADAEPFRPGGDDGWIGSFEPDEDNDVDGAADPWQRRQDVRLAMLAIADGLGEAEAHLAEYRDHAPAALERPRLVARIARRLTAAGRAAEALALLEGVELTQGWRSDGARPWLDAQLEAMEAIGHVDAAQALRREFGIERLSLSHLRAFLQRLPAFEDGEAEEELLEAVLEHRSFDASLEFLHRWPDQRRAARLILAHPDRLNGADEPLLTAVAAGLEERHPLAASLCLRAMIEEVLETAHSSRYARAVRHLENCRRLAAGIAEWGRIPPHNAYVRELLRAYGHRMGFLRKLDFDGLLLPE
ncbi:DUF6880 family protein [Synechococcus sp. CCAP 1479/9]|uniref:DUF6880 family protein n=1 Tax=Synechococcus sp. CCAP 1479/9 TaxID=1221593 RepID=UPI001C21359F|nr:DUF6880 family protein [Synechococcus sp. CCAP 1479/9]